MYSRYKVVIWEQMEIWASIELRTFFFFPCEFCVIIESLPKEKSKLRYC